MTNKFVNALKEETNLGKTDNGATCYKSTTNSLLDLFGTIGALREKTPQVIESAFIKAFSEDQLLATKMMFMARNCRGGLGEKRTYKVILKFLANHYPEIVKKNFEAIEKFGRYDDFMTLMDTKVENEMIEFIRAQLSKDFSDMLAGEPISLLSKWMPSENVSSQETRKLARKVIKKLGATPKEYRKMLSKMRKYIDVTEVKMSSGKWTEIEYGKVSSGCMKNNRKAFQRHDEEGFGQFMTKVESGEEVIKSSTLYPYDILRGMQLSFDYRRNFSVKQDRVLEAQWKALPNYIEGEHNVLVMADTSQSMMGQPIMTSIGLAMYFAERNSGAFKDTFMTFSSEPSLVTLKGKSVYEKVQSIPCIVQDTNIEKAFELVLQTALRHKLTNEEMVEAIVIISDGQFNQMTVDNGRMSFYDTMKQRFERYGYSLPNIVFWNVNGTETFQVKSDYKGVQLVSGHSTSTFKKVLECIGYDPLEAMIKTLSDPVYDCIIVE